MKFKIKAIGDWELSVLAIPFGSPSDRDGHGEYFDANTNLHRERFPNPAVHYYHAMTPDDQGIPEEIGEVKSSEVRKDGVWYRIVLNQASKFAKLVMDAARRGLARASSGTAPHLARIARDGQIKNWPLIEISLMDTDGKNKLQPANKRAVALPVVKALFDKAGIELPDNLSEDEMETEAERTAAAVKAAEKKLHDEYAVKNRLPFKEKLPKYLKHSGELGKFDNLDAGDQAFLVEVLNSDRNGPRASENALKALAIKLDEDRTELGNIGQRSMRAMGLKGDEVMHTDLTSYGDEWVGVAYSSALWEKIRAGTFVAQKLPTIEVPQGVESMYLPIESDDPTWYNVAETEDHEATDLIPVPTVTSSQVTTGRVQMTPGKLGARVPWSGEMSEDSLIPFAAQIRRQLQDSGAENLEHVIIDGDTETGNSANINDIDTTPTAGDGFLIFDGFRKSCLVTTAANSRDGGVLAIDDFMETSQLMGTSGMNAIDHTKVDFIIDPATHYKSLGLAATLTKDVFSQPTLEGGMLRGIYGHGVYVSVNIHKRSSKRLANASGMVDADTEGNNTKGVILAVRWDGWRLGYKRRMTIESTRYPRSDSWELTALMRVGLIQRSTEASAITYNLTIS